MLRILVFISLMLSAPVWALSEITAVIDKNPVLTNESFVLEITADDDLNRNAIDTTILLRDFVVGQTNISRSTRIINGKTKRSTTWTTLLMCRTPGTYTIPAFSAKGVSSSPIQLQVAKHSDQTDRPRDIFFRNQLVTKQVYLNQTGVLDTKLYLAVQLERGSLSDPEAEGISFKQMGEDQDKIEILNGRRYRVITRKYAITPTQTGTITLRPPMFSGTVVTGQPRGFFDNAQTKPVQVVADDLTIDVLAKPEAASEPFIPAQYITLDESFDLPAGGITVGEPVTRKIVVTATGIDQSVLPPLAVQYPKSLNIYPDKPEITTSYQGNSVITEYVDTAAIIATAPGVIELPAVTIDYWDTRYHQMTQATLPARTITVVAGNDEPAPAQLTPIPVAVEPTKATTNPFYQWFSYGLLLLWLLTLAGWWLHARSLRQRQPKLVDDKPSTQPDPSELSCWRQLEQALAQQSSAAVNQTLPLWLQQLAHCQSLQQLPPSDSQQAAVAAYQQVLALTYAKQLGSDEARQNAFTELEAALQTVRRHQQQQSKQVDPLTLYR